MTAETGAELAADLLAAGKPQPSPHPLAEETLAAHADFRYLFDADLPVRPATDEEKARPVPDDLAAILAAGPPVFEPEPEPEVAETATADDEAQHAAEDILHRWAPRTELPVAGPSVPAALPDPTGDSDEQ